MTLATEIWVDDIADYREAVRLAQWWSKNSQAEFFVRPTNSRSFEIVRREKKESRRGS